MTRELPLNIDTVRISMGLILVIVVMLFVLLFSGNIGVLPDDIEELLVRLLLLALVVLVVFVVGNR